MPANTIVKGKIISGFGRGKVFTSIDWLKVQVAEQFGFTPWPGTLNLTVGEAARQFLVEAGDKNPRRLDPPGNGCGAGCVGVLINGSVPGVVVLPDITDHKPDCIEIMAPIAVREALGLSDGDEVSLHLG